jgi:hypothetical protein
MDDADLAALNFTLSLQLADYWHDVDTNWGRTAGSYYTEDGQFHGEQASSLGRAKIQQFYNWRERQGPRLAVHSVTNFRAWFDGPARAGATWYLFLYAANGERILPTHPPVTISLVTDRYRREDGRWLCEDRRIQHWFEGDTPITNPNLDDD